ncbi:amino acid ABC transporter membrane protein, PAAT family [Verrucomicrobium sp. GAS474]|uniref:amino acid ABC transporter permease n=1 Tax=Verrucomicrobium sp. GAS474 TaxID=1882831 RepID=UPI00087A4D91|nr:amino acid ABC transporter permease [Verrucomicrobium sp. GAS474]SDT90401.1 amino acid ABC transporter membrane protein, PAAT family [Verrucomicrobium sp. GAS474]
MKTETASSPSCLRRALSWLLVFAVLSLGFTLAFGSLRYQWHWEAVWEYRAKFLSGWLVTVALSLGALAGSVVLGMGAALLRRAPVLPLRQAARVYVEAVRGTPLLVQILILYYIVGDALGLQNRYLAGVVILSLFGGAYVGEIVRAGIEGIGASQFETARALGFTTAQTYRYVVLPQALRHMLPSLAGQFVSLVKDSSLLSLIAVDEFTQNARQVNAFTYSTLEAYLPLAVGYLILTLPLSLWTQSLEKRFQYET